MDQNKAIALVASGMVEAQVIIGDADTTGWVWQYYKHEGEWFAVRFAGDMAIAVEVFDSFEDSDEHATGWFQAEDRAMGLDTHEDADDSEFVYTEVED